MSLQESSIAFEETIVFEQWGENVSAAESKLQYTILFILTRRIRMARTTSSA
jgi:hypothetical protein